MQTRPLGSSGIEASVVAFGAWAVGGWMWGGQEEKDSIDAIRAGIDAGMGFIDTAPVYGFGQSEQVVGKAIQGRRKDVVLATKCGLVWDSTDGDFFFTSTEDRVGAQGGEINVYRNLRPKKIRQEVDASLKRLKTDYIDLYQTHWQDKTTPIGGTMEALLRLKEEGKIRAIGCSNATPEQMDAYRAVGPLDVDQELYSMLDRKYEATNLPYCAQHNVAFLAYSPLAQGLLTGKVTPEREFDEGDQRRYNKRFSVEGRQIILKMLDAFQDVARKHELTLGQLAIAWAVHQPGSTHALVGARNPKQALENAKAGAAKLDADDLAHMADVLKEFGPKIPATR